MGRTTFEWRWGRCQTSFQKRWENSCRDEIGRSIHTTHKAVETRFATWNLVLCHLGSRVDHLGNRPPMQLFPRPNFRGRSTKWRFSVHHGKSGQFRATSRWSAPVSKQMASGHQRPVRLGAARPMSYWQFRRSGCGLKSAPIATSQQAFFIRDYRLGADVKRVEQKCLQSHNPATHAAARSAYAKSSAGRRLGCQEGLPVRLQEAEAAGAGATGPLRPPVVTVPHSSSVVFVEGRRFLGWGRLVSRLTFGFRQAESSPR